MIRIALTNLGKYNEGELCYKWLDLPYTDDELSTALDQIGIDGLQYEEYFITNYETDLDGLHVDEYANLQELNELAQRIESVDNDLLAAIIEVHTSNLTEALELAENEGTYLYNDQSIEDIAQSDIDDGIWDTETLLRYIDLEAFARDMYEFDGYSETSKGVLRV